MIKRYNLPKSHNCNHFEIIDYIGCFPNCPTQLTGLTQSMADSEGAGQLLYSYFIKSSTMTVEYCRDFCLTLNFSYAGLDGG